MQPAIPRIELLLANEGASETLAAAVAPHFRPGFVLYLSGDLGTGKTTFARAVLHALGYRGRVPSPTFTLVQPYNLSSFQLYHFDLYRFSSPEQWRDAGFDEHLGGDDAAIVEWPELGAGLLPPPDVWLRLTLDARERDGRDVGAGAGTSDVDADDGGQPRLVAASAGTEWGRQCLIGIVDAIRLGLLAGVSLRGDWLPPVP